MRSSITPEPWASAMKEWAHLETFGTVTRVFASQGSFRPYLQGRVGLVRIHPRSRILYNKPSKDL
jgi:hypothetical protein